MRNDMSLAWKSGVLALFACVALVGCGGDDTEDAAGSGGSGGSAGTEAGSAGTSGDGGDGGGGAGGTGGSGGTGGAGGGFELVCTEDLPTAPLTCGTTECPMPMPVGGTDTCQRPCCVADACGTKSTAEAFPTECAVPAQPDPRCPNLDFMGMPLEGCCTVDNECGIISALRGNSCITESMIVQLPPTPRACDAVGGDDAGAP